MSAARNAEPIPNATTRARVESGRAMSGRIGISLASTVRSVIDVPPTHSSGVNLTWPAWTDAISSSVEAKIVRRPTAGRPRSAVRAPAGASPIAARQRRRQVRSRSMAPTRARGCGRPGRRPAPRSRARGARRRAGDPRCGISTNGTIRLPVMAPIVLTATRSPIRSPHGARRRIAVPMLPGS